MSLSKSGIIRYVIRDASQASASVMLHSNACFSRSDASIAAPSSSHYPLLVGLVTTVGLGTIPGNHVSTRVTSVKWNLHVSINSGIHLVHQI